MVLYDKNQKAINKILVHHYWFLCVSWKHYSFLSHLSVEGLHEKRREKASVCVCVSSPEPSVRSAVPESQSKLWLRAGARSVFHSYSWFSHSTFSASLWHTVHTNQFEQLSPGPKRPPLLTPSDGRMILLSSLYNVCKYHLYVRLTLEREMCWFMKSMSSVTNQPPHSDLSQTLSPVQAPSDSWATLSHCRKQSMFHWAMEINTFCLYNNRERDMKIEMPTSFSVCTLGGASNTYFRYYIFTHTRTHKHVQCDRFIVSGSAFR